MRSSRAVSPGFKRPKAHAQGSGGEAPFLILASRPWDCQGNGVCCSEPAAVSWIEWGVGRIKMVIKEVLSQRKSIKEFNENKLRKVGHVPRIAHRLKTVLYCVKEVADMVIKDKTCSRSTSTTNWRVHANCFSSQAVRLSPMLLSWTVTFVVELTLRELSGRSWGPGTLEPLHGAGHWLLLWQWLSDSGWRGGQPWAWGAVWEWIA